jgi:hypothetical protein
LNPAIPSDPPSISGVEGERISQSKNGCIAPASTMSVKCSLSHTLI